jgi:gliding motility-associated-like protein
MNLRIPRLLILLLLLNRTLAYAQPVSGNPLPSPTNSTILCTDTSRHLLLQEDTLAVSAGAITQTRDGNLLIPGFYYPDRGLFYNMPYLIKCTPQGTILWSKKYPSTGGYPSNWFTATRIRELAGGDLLMTGQIGVPGTDDRRELAVWRLDANGGLLWSSSYESTLWSNPITGATAITDVQEDASGNVYLCGDNKQFEASKFAFILKMDAKGVILWDDNYASSAAFAYGLLLLQGKVLLVGELDPLNALDSVSNNVLWCLQLDPASGNLISKTGWVADFGGQSAANSFYYANTSVTLMDNGQISVQGTAHSDFYALFNPRADSIVHSIVATFSPEFGFQSGLMLGSRHPANYYNTVTTRQPGGRISFTRFVETNRLYQEAILFGTLGTAGTLHEKIYHEPGRSSQTTSNILFFPPGQDLVVQTYWDTAAALGGLEFFRLRDGDTSTACDGQDTILTYILPYAMKPAFVQFDSVMSGTFRPTFHNQVSVADGLMGSATSCSMAGVKLEGTPQIALDHDSILCQGSTRQLTARQGDASYLWSTGATGPTLEVSDTGLYWVAVTDRNGCKGSDTTHIAQLVRTPAGFLPPDTTICQFDKLTIVTSRSFASYLWSDQSTAPTLTVSQPGLYGLQVTDSNQCSGSDSILLTQKQCLEGFYIPNAFTPGRGHNEVFRPLVLGRVDHYAFSVYNRWGERVFETHEPGQGWDGRLNGVPLAAGPFVWVCSYQFLGQAMQSKSGTVLLVQ